MIGYNIAIDLLAIMISVGGILFGIGYALNDFNLKKYGKEELIESLINGIIIGVLIISLSPSGIFYDIMQNSVISVSGNLSCGSMSNNYAICFAYNFLISPSYVEILSKYYPSLIDNSMGLLIPISGIYTILGLIASLKFSIGIVSITLSTLLRPILSIERDIIEMLTFINLSIYVQSVLLKFVDIVSLSVLLPVGMILRVFYFTRRLGSSILALTLALFMVFPMTYVLNATLISNYSVSSIKNITNQSVSKTDSFESLLISTESGNSIAGSSLVSFYSSSTNFVKYMNGFIQSIVDYLALLIVEVVFLPLLSIILTIISARELARIMGSEISFGRFDVF